ncbi:diaminopimelate decarboxylase 2, chloroplastic-like [Apium graveolens]|uniref:diaminopimelate decarboxylase 2, chloroplastic-like n=1 Tax=Apium graveolens TaxID=4045 RepID=UPI003D79CBD8
MVVADYRGNSLLLFWNLNLITKPLLFGYRVTGVIQMTPLTFIVIAGSMSGLIHPSLYDAYQVQHIKLVSSTQLPADAEVFAFVTVGLVLQVRIEHAPTRIPGLLTRILHRV